MLSGQVIQNTIDGIRAITHTSLAVCDMGGQLLNQSGDIRGINDKTIEAFAGSDAVEQSAGDLMLYKVFDDHDPEYVIITSTEEPNARMSLRLAAMQLENLNTAYRERFDRDNFIKNLLLDNMLLIDIYNRARKLHIDINAERCVFITEIKGSESLAQDIMRKQFGREGTDFVTTVEEDHIVLIKEITDLQEPDRELSSCAELIQRSLFMQGIESRVAYGSTISEIKEVSRSYKEAKMALDVGKIFYSGKNVVAFSKLGIGRLIYQLPLPLCRMFIKETFDGKSPDEFDEETLTTINKFFENSLNVSETSRQLYIHRNTLVYRLDKLQKSTGLDLRVFEDAITFKIALMVVKYMKYMENMDY